MAFPLFRPGLVSISFRKLAPEALIQEVAAAGLSALEWGGDVHVPHGDIARASQVGQWTRDAGLEVAAYGSYYRLAETEDNPDVEAVLESALALGAPTIRVWAGRRSSQDADEAYRQRVIEDANRICQLAGKENLRVCLEYHGGSLTDSLESAQSLLEALPLANLDTLWQPPNGMPDDHCEKTLRSVLPRVSNLHVFHWGPEGWKDRRPFEEGTARWRRFFEIADDGSTSRYTLMEFVKDDSLEQLRQDAAVLHDILTQP